MKYLLDTDTCITLIRQQSPDLLQRIVSLQVGDIGLSSITVAELFYGVERSQRREQNEAALIQFLSSFEIVDFDAAAASMYGRVRAALEKAGTPIGALDLLIAAAALSAGTTLVTNNLREFQRVEGLKAESWG